MIAQDLAQAKRIASLQPSNKGTLSEIARELS